MQGNIDLVKDFPVAFEVAAGQDAHLILNLLPGVRPSAEMSYRRAKNVSSKGVDFWCVSRVNELTGLTKQIDVLSSYPSLSQESTAMH